MTDKRGESKVGRNNSGRRNSASTPNTTTLTRSMSMVTGRWVANRANRIVTVPLG